MSLQLYGIEPRPPKPRLYYGVMSANRIKLSEIARRRFLRGALAAAGLPPLCCVSRVAPADSLSLERGRLVVDLTRVPELRKRATSVAVVTPQFNLLLIHAASGEYVAMNRACTHGGAMCTYNSKRTTVQCTSLNHAEYDLRGTLLHGRTHGNLRTYPARLAGASVEIEVGTTA